MHIELVGLANVLLHKRQQDSVEEDLRRLGLRRDKYACRCVGCVWCPVVRTGNGNEGFPGRDRRQDLERLGQLAALVAAQDETNLRVYYSCLAVWQNRCNVQRTFNNLGWQFNGVFWSTAALDLWLLHFTSSLVGSNLLKNERSQIRSGP
jgi:hypothetical protein